MRKQFRTSKTNFLDLIIKKNRLFFSIHFVSIGIRECLCMVNAKRNERKIFSFHANSVDAQQQQNFKKFHFLCHKDEYFFPHNNNWRCCTDREKKMNFRIPEKTLEKTSLFLMLIVCNVYI